ncbi:MAG: hypothetical protein WBD40_19070, partial [Tepidisphaeraceae bacterium]
ERVSAMGGEIHRGGPVPQSALDALRRIERATAELEQLAADDVLALAEAGEGNFAGQPAFDRAHAEVEQRMSVMRAAQLDCERVIAALAASGRSAAERAQGLALQEQLDDAVHRCRQLHERREAAEQEMTRLYARHTGALTDRPAAEERLLWSEVGRIAAEQGLDVTPTDDGIRIRTPHGWMTCGPGLRFDTNP